MILNNTKLYLQILFSSIINTSNLFDKNLFSNHFSFSFKKKSEKTFYLLSNLCYRVLKLIQGFSVQK